ncbi:MAG TPA: POTRA domain-containing protein, partial [Acidobacteriota bacterium]
MNRRLNRSFRPALAVLLLLLLPGRQPAVPPWQNFQVGQVLLLNDQQRSDPRLLPYRPLVAIRSGENYQYNLVRKSIENLSRTGVFADIEVKVQSREGSLLDVYFVLLNKPVIHALEFSDVPAISKRELRDAIYSLRKKDLFDESKLAKAQEELQSLFKSRGYFNAQISPHVSLSPDRSGCTVQFVIAPGRIARIQRLQVEVNDGQLAKIIRGYFQGDVYYRPGEFAKRIDKAKKLLKKHLYYFPEIKVQEDFLNPERSTLNVTVAIACGYKYNFVFQGMKARMPLIADVWERQVFEKWAEEESRARLLNYLKNDGYTDARVTSAITSSGVNKTIVFTVRKNSRYRLGKITVHGNHAVSNEKVGQIIKSGDLIFNKLAWLRINSLVADMEVLKLYYYYQGV